MNIVQLKVKQLELRLLNFRHKLFDFGFSNTVMTAVLFVVIGFEQLPTDTFVIVYVNAPNKEVGAGIDTVELEPDVEIV